MMPNLSLLRRLVFRFFTVAAMANVLLPAPPVSAQAAMQSARVTLATRSAQALSNATDMGAIPSSQTLFLTLTLAPTSARTAALDQFLAGVTTPSSPSFHQWLTPAQFAETYGATSGQLAAASAWAQTQSLSVDAVSPSGLRLSLSGSAAHIQTAFAVSLHFYQVNSALYFANTADPSLPAPIASLFTAIDGLDDLPTSSELTSAHASAQSAAVTAPPAFSTLAGLVDANATPILSLSSTLSTSTLSASQLAEYTALFRQAAAQGITTLASTSAGDFPATLANVTAVALPGDPALVTAPTDARPQWQSAPGLPANALRYAPDLTASSVAGLAQTLTSIAAGGRLGNVDATLYTLAPTPGLYTQPDSAPAGTWESTTGLGMVNLQTLVKVYPRGAGMSYTSFSASNYSPVHGQATTFTSSVTSGTGGGVPTGTVSFVTSAGTVLGTVNLINGMATLSLSTLAGGSYTVDAVYSGDGTYASSTSPTGQIFVQPEPSQLSVAISGTPTVGGIYTLTISDTAASGVGQPSGTVSVNISGTSSTYTGTLASIGTSSSATTVSIPATTVGTLTLSISCTTSASYSCYNPYTTTVTISKATPVLSIAYSPNPPASGAAITLNATVSTAGTAPAPTGAVTFYDNGTILNAGQLSAGATTATGTVPSTSTHTITATYAGDANYNSVSTAASSTSIGTTSTSTSIGSSSSTVTAGQAITFTAMVTPASTGSASPTGTVQFFDNSVLIGTAPLAGASATFTTSSLSATTGHSIYAVYSGDGSYTGSTSSSYILTPQTATIVTSLTLSASAANVTPGQSIVLTATVILKTSHSTAATGSVTFYDYATNSMLGVATVSNFVATLTTSALSASIAHTIYGVYSGDALYESIGSSGLIIGKAVALTATTTNITLSSASVVAGSSVLLSAAITPAITGPAPTGTVEFLAGGNILCSATVSASAATCSTTPTLTGSSLITAFYSGDSNYAASTSSAATLTVASALGTGALTAVLSSSAATPGSTAVVVASVTAPTGVVPTGTISVLITNSAGTTSIASYSAVLPVGSSSAASVSIPIVVPATAATYKVTVSCTNTNFTCASTSLALVSSAATTSLIITATTLTAVASTTLTGDVLLTATVTPAATGSAALSGTVAFFNGSTALATATIVNGVATATVVLPTTTTLSFNAVYSGDANYTASISPAVTSVSANATTSTASIALTSNITSGLAGTEVILTAQVSGLTSGGGVPTGTVSFYAAGTTPQLLGTGTLTKTGSNVAVASFSTTGLSAASEILYAVYNGDTNFASVISNDITLGLSDYSLTFIPPILTLARGQTGITTVTVAITGTFPLNINFGCTPPPNTQITCSFSPTLLTGGGSTLLTITTALPKTASVLPGPLAGRIAARQALGAVSFAALLCLLFPGRARRRLPTVLLVSFALGLTANLGCSNSVSAPGTLSTQGTPLGTSVLTINTAGTNGLTTITHNYTYQVTVQ